LNGRGGADLLYDDPGSDRVFAGSGRNDIYAGSGGDTLYADDGYRDYIDCGSGFDRVQRDNFDRVADCEQRL
jgi:Ca2+-binding RTX toxin-like protein